MKKFSLVGLLGIGILSGCFLLGGCSSSDVDPNTVAGTELHDQSGYDKGTVVDSDSAHTFPNGVTEPGVKMSYGTGEDRTEYWLPQRSADQLSPSQ